MPSYADPSNVGNPPGSGPLRSGGVPLPDIVTPSKNLPSTVSKAAERQQPAVTLLRDVVGGTETVRAARGTYLPQAPGEDGQNYMARLLRSVFVNVTGRTVEGLVGQLFRRDPELGEDVPSVIAQHWENIDLAGNHGDVFSRALAQDAIVAGHAGILVEFPKTDGTQNSAQESSGAIRPYWVPIRKDDLISWRIGVVDGQTVLTQLVIKECQMVPDGEFGEAKQERYRVFTRDLASGQVAYRLLAITDNKEVIEVEAGTYPTQTEIPFAEITTNGRQGLLESTPPLLDLAYLNIAHYQTLSDYLTSIHKTCVPVYVETGIDPEPEGAAPVVIGPNTARRFTNPQAKAQYVSHDGAALGSVEKAIQNMLADMGRLGLAMLTPQNTSGPETATAHRQDKSTEDSALSVTARGVEDGLERALSFHAKYLRLPGGGSVSINREFDEQTMAADMLVAWTSAVANAGIPARYMIAAMQDGDLIPRDDDAAMIADEIAANQAAIAEQEAQRQADLLALKQQPAPKAAA